MLKQLESAQAQWGGASSAVDNWLAERQDLLIRYCKLSGKPPFERKTLPSPEQLQKFCQVLVDYVSAGHFEIYQGLVTQCREHGASSLALLNELFPRLDQTTEVALQFNDKYDDFTDDNWQDFDRDLSQLGEQLALRIELEDRLIGTLAIRHREASLEAG